MEIKGTPITWESIAWVILAVFVAITIYSAINYWIDQSDPAPVIQTLTCLDGSTKNVNGRLPIDEKSLEIACNSSWPDIYSVVKDCSHGWETNQTSTTTLTMSCLQTYGFSSFNNQN